MNRPATTTSAFVKLAVSRNSKSKNNCKVLSIKNHSIFPTKMEGAQSRVQEAISKMVNTLDTGCLRKMQVNMYQCSAKCCENSTASLEDVQNCIDTCSRDVNKAQAYLQSEIENFQNRLQRCAMSCQDKLRDQMPAKPSDQDIQKGRSGLEKCVVECADSHVGLIPGLTKKMLDTLKSKSY